MTAEVIRGELDFFVDDGNVNGATKWAVELLVDGDKINEHVGRFDRENGKYGAVGHRAHIVVDYRKGRRPKEA